MRPRARWLAVVGAAAVSALTVAATATSTGASGESSTSEDELDLSSVEDDHHDRRDEHDHWRQQHVDRRQHVLGADVARRAASSAPDGRAVGIGGLHRDAGRRVRGRHRATAAGRRAASGASGPTGATASSRSCGRATWSSSAPSTTALGRPTTNVEALIADPANNVTPNQAQTDLLNAELAAVLADRRRVGAVAAGTAVTTTTDGAAPTTAPDRRCRVRRVHLGTRGVVDHGRLTPLPGAPGSECRLGPRFSRLAACSTCRGAR